MLDSTLWHEPIDKFVDELLWVVEKCMDDPKDFFRSFTTEEIARVWNMAPKTESPRVRSMPIYKRFYDMIASGAKTVEVRVAYSSMKKIQVGQTIRFECRSENCLTNVKRVSNYESFDQLLATEDLSAINPSINKEDQLKELRKIFSPDKEALGVLAIEIEKLA